MAKRFFFSVVALILLFPRDSSGQQKSVEKIFKTAAKLGKILEINAFPNRLDLPDVLIREAKRFGVRFSIGTDSHQTSQLALMEYGVANARRGWVEAKEVINTLPLKKIKDILNLKD